ncbi:MAG: hypothetical protein IPN38_08420 [Flavobacteriales bacterium]|nr:hypothetical protein [Flavobacteriales bacterium]
MLRTQEGAIVSWPWDHRHLAAPDDRYFAPSFFRLLGPALGLVVFLALRYIGDAQAAAMAGTVLWMAVW